MLKRSLPSESTVTAGLAKKKMRSNYSDLITVVVGHGVDTTPFKIYEDLICSRSGYFRDKCQSQEDRTFRLPRDDPVVFHQYVEGINCDIVDFVDIVGCETFVKDGKKQAKSKDGGKSAVFAMCKLWELAKYLRDTTFQNQVMDSLITMVAGYNFSIGLDSVQFVGRKESLEKSALRRWLVDALAPKLTVDALAKCGKEYPRDLVLELLQKCVELMGPSGRFYKHVPNSGNRFSYHEVDEEDVKSEESASS